MTISEVSEKYDLSQDTLRYYERIGLPLEVLIEYVTLFQKGDKTLDARKDLLKEQRDILAKKLHDIQATIDRLDYKIERYESKIVPREKELPRHNQLAKDE